MVEEEKTLPKNKIEVKQMRNRMYLKLLRCSETEAMKKLEVFAFTKVRSMKKGERGREIELNSERSKMALVAWSPVDLLRGRTKATKQTRMPNALSITICNITLVMHQC